MTRPALIAADALFALAGTERDAVKDFEALALLPSDRAAAVTALRALPPASAEHPYPSVTLSTGSPLMAPRVLHLLAFFVRDGALSPEALEDYADALRVWDREEREMGDGEKARTE